MGEGEIFALNAHNTHLIKIIHHVLQAGKKKKGYKAAERPIFTFNFKDSGVSGVETKTICLNLIAQTSILEFGGEERWPSLGGLG